MAGRIRQTELHNDVNTKINKTDKIGDLTSLTTTAKDTLVNAIKENTAQLAQTTTKIDSKFDYVEIVGNFINFIANGQTIRSLNLSYLANQEVITSYIDGLVSSGIIESGSVSDGSISAIKTDFLFPSKNLFNPLTVIKGSYLDNKGATVSNANFSTSSKIRCNVGEYITASYNNADLLMYSVNFYTVDNAWLSGVSNIGINNVLVPTNAYYCIVSYSHKNYPLYENVQIENTQDGIKTSFEKHKLTLSQNVYIDSLEQLRISMDNLDEWSNATKSILGDIAILSRNIINTNKIIGKTVSQLFSTGGTWAIVASKSDGTLIDSAFKNNVNYYPYCHLNETRSNAVNFRCLDKDGSVIAVKTDGVLVSDNLANTHYVEMYLSTENQVALKDKVITALYINEGGDKGYDKFNANYTSINETVEYLTKPNLKYRGFPAMINKLNINATSITFFNDELVNFTVNADDHSVFSNFYFRNKDTGDINLSLQHNFGHCNTIDYCEGNDSLILGNGGQSTVPNIGEIYIINKFSHLRDMPSGSQVPLDTYATKIDLSPFNFGYKANVIWGESNGGAFDMCYLITSDIRYIRKLQLGKGSNNLGQGTLIPDRNLDEFNGTFKVVKEWVNDNTIQIQDAQYHNGIIYAGGGHDSYVVYKIKLSPIVDSVEIEVMKEVTYDNLGNSLASSRYSQGICIKENKMYYSDNSSVGIYQM